MKLLRHKDDPKGIRCFKIISTGENVSELSTISQCCRKTLDFEPK